jgi:hypothetical protein
MNPTTRYGKGTAVIERVQRNEQLMIEGFESEDEDLAPASAMPTWFLLYQHSRLGGKVRLHAELSLPTGAKDGRRIDTWHERIILPFVDFEPLIVVEDEPTPLDEIDIPISRLG